MQTNLCHKLQPELAITEITCAQKTQSIPSYLTQEARSIQLKTTVLPLYHELWQVSSVRQGMRERHHKLARYLTDRGRSLCQWCSDG